MNLKYSAIKSQYHPNNTITKQLFQRKLKGLNRSQSTIGSAKSTKYNDISQSSLSSSFLTKQQFYHNQSHLTPHKQASFRDVTIDENDNSVFLFGVTTEQKTDSRVQEQTRTSSLINKLTVWDKEHVDFNHNNNKYKYAESQREIEAYGLLLNRKESNGNMALKALLKENQSNMINTNSKEMVISQMIHKRRSKYQTKSTFDFSVFTNKGKLQSSSSTGNIHPSETKQIKLVKKKPKTQSVIEFNEEDSHYNSYKQFVRQQNKIEMSHRDKLYESFQQLVINRLKKLKYDGILNDIYILLEEARTECSLSIDLINERIKKHHEFYRKSNEGLILKNTKLQLEQKFSMKRLLKKDTLKSIQLSNELQAMREESHESDSNNSSDDFSLGAHTHKSSTLLANLHGNVIVENKGGHSRKQTSTFDLNQEKIKLYNEYKTIEGELYDKIKINNDRFEEIKCELTKMINENKQKIEETNTLMFTLKQMFQGLIRQQKAYYLQILKQGNDTRTIGLSWVIKRLLELNIEIDSSFFPNYLDSEQIGFLIKKADIENEIYQLKQISKTLKERQQEILNEDHLQRLAQFAALPKWDDKDFIFTFFQREKDEDKGFLVKLNKKYEKIVEKHEELLKKTREQKMETNQIKAIVKSIRKKITKSASCEKGLIKEDEHDDTRSPELVEKFLNEEQAQKNYYKDLRTIHQRIKVLEMDLDLFIKNEIVEFKRKFQMIQEKKKHDLDEATSYHDTLSNALFGTSIVV